ncbi:hypothetical protein AAZX31_16G171800 [Glycine max]
MDPSSQCNSKRKTLQQEVMAPKHKPKSVYFEPSSVVEVRINDDGFRGSWFSGTIFRFVAAKSSWSSTIT